MSRPSRGFSVAHTSAGPAPVCPSTGTITITELAPDNWQLTFTWTPSPQIGDLLYYVSIDGGPPMLINHDNDVDSPFDGFIDPSLFGSPGQTAQVTANASNVAGCANFSFAPASRIIS